MKKSILSILFGCILYAISYPPCFAQDLQKDNCVSIALFAINDYHGAFVENERKSLPGIANIIETLDSLKQVYPYHLTVACGDNFGGSYFATATKSALMPVFFQALDIDISALGNHEFDNGQEYLISKFSDSKYLPLNWRLDYVCANISDSEGQKPEFCEPYVIRNIVVSPTCSLKVAFTGLITSSTSTQTRKSNIQGLSFNPNYSEVIISLENHDADLNILLTHIGTTTHNGKPAWDDPNVDQMLKLGKQNFQGIFSAHTHNAVCGTINADNIPVVQGECNGLYIGMLECLVDTARHQVVEVIPNLIKVKDHEKFGKKALKVNSLVEEILRTTKTDAGFSLGEYLTQAEEDLVHDRKQKYCFTEVASLVCESYAEAYKKHAPSRPDEIVFGISHFGSIRTGFKKGNITVLDIGEALPFFNELRAFRMTGKELKTLVEFGLHNKKYGWLQMSDLQIHCNNAKEKKVKSLYYMTPKGKKVKIKNRTIYTIIADEYITTGGDGYDVSFFPKDKEVELKNMPKSTDAFISYLKAKKSLKPDISQTNRLTYDK